MSDVKRFARHHLTLHYLTNQHEAIYKVACMLAYNIIMYHFRFCTTTRLWVRSCSVQRTTLMFTEDLGFRDKIVRTL